jgi:hypothetical protein
MSRGNFPPVSRRPWPCVGLKLAGGLHTLEWLVGLSTAWQTLRIGAAVGRLMEGGDGRRR